MTKETVLEEAQRLVYGERQAAYGHPREGFQDAARIWSVILGVEVDPDQVVLCMIGLKIARELASHKRDNLVDIAGYAACLEMLQDAPPEDPGDE